MIIALNPTFTMENLEWPQQLFEKKSKFVSQFGGEIFESQNKNLKRQGLGLKIGEKIENTTHETSVNETSRHENLLHETLRNVASFYRWELIVEIAESFFNSVYKWIDRVLTYSFAFIKCSIKCLTDFTLVNLTLIKELNIIRQFRIQIGTFSSPAQQPDNVNNNFNFNFNITIISGAQGSNCKDEYHDILKCGLLEPLLKNYPNLGVFPLKV